MAESKNSVEIINKGNWVGKLFIAGYCLGACLEGFSCKKTAYRKYFSTNLALIGIPLYLMDFDINSKFKKVKLFLKKNTSKV